MGPSRVWAMATVMITASWLDAAVLDVVSQLQVLDDGSLAVM